MKDFFVTVLRYAEHADGSASLFGEYISKVYDIKDNMFLVYDGGSDTIPEQGFRWVDFRDCTNELYGYRPIVTLVREDE